MRHGAFTQLVTVVLVSMPTLQTLRELTFIGPVGKVRRDGKNTGPQAAFIENAERIARVSEAGGARCRRLWRQAPLPRGRVT